MKKLLNSGEAQTGMEFDAVGNPEPSLLMQEGAETMPKGSRTKRSEAGATRTDNAEGYDIVPSGWKHSAASDSSIVCNKCGSSDAEADFYPYNRTVCKPCLHKQQNEWQRRNAEKVRARSKANWDKHSEKYKKTRNKVRRTPEGRKKRNLEIKCFFDGRPEVKKAQNRAQHLKRKGVLVPPNSCEGCEKEKLLEMHHSDYSKPDCVEWLCKDCHNEQNAITKAGVE